MVAVYRDTTLPSKRSPQHAETARVVSRISERDRELVLRLCEQTAEIEGATTATVAQWLQQRHIRLSEADVCQILLGGLREYRQRVLTMRGHMEAALQEDARIPRENRQERAEAA